MHLYLFLPLDLAVRGTGSIGCDGTESDVKRTLVRNNRKPAANLQNSGKNETCPFRATLPVMSGANGSADGAAGLASSRSMINHIEKNFTSGLWIPYFISKQVFELCTRFFLYLFFYAWFLFQQKDATVLTFLAHYPDTYLWCERQAPTPHAFVWLKSLISSRDNDDYGSTNLPWLKDLANSRTVSRHQARLLLTTY
jgi:hypothetical protein